MRVKLDENLPTAAVEIFESAGHNVDTAEAEGLKGANDPDLLTASSGAKRLTITLDRGFGDIRVHPPGTHEGILVIRLDDQSPRHIARAVEQVGTAVDLESLRGCIAVWRDGDLRVRRPPE